MRLAKMPFTIITANVCHGVKKVEDKMEMVRLCEVEVTTFAPVTMPMTPKLNTVSCLRYVHALASIITSSPTRFLHTWYIPLKSIHSEWILYPESVWNYRAAIAREEADPCHPEILENAPRLPSFYAPIVDLSRPGVTVHL